MSNPTCEVCKKAPAKNDDILCADCSHAYTILLELLHEHPGLAAEDLQRIRLTFDWRMKNIPVIRS